MSGDKAPLLSVSDMFAARAARQQHEHEQEMQLKHREEEEMATFRKRLETFELTDMHRVAVIERIKRAFERGDTELMLTAFPSEFCTDQGRAVNNPPLNPPPDGVEPHWLATLPGGARPVYDFWKRELAPGGFKFTARIIDFPGGMPGNVGLFFSWPKSAE
jgi:hypothetical protein